MRLHKGLSNRRLYLSIVEGYRDPVTKKVKTRTLRSLGYADSLAKINGDPVAFGMRILEEMKRAAACEQTADKVAIHSNERLSESVSYNKLLGYAPLSMLYRDLGLDQFFTNQARKLDVKYDLNSIVRLLVYSRILFPGSKKKTYEGKDMYFDKSDFTLDDIYHSLGFISTLKNSLVKYVHNRIEKEKPRNLSRVYYDVTNYYFEIDEQDNLRKKGVSKEYRPDPIIQMGLLMDGDGIPITYSLFPGNTNDCETMIPVMRRLHADYGLGRMVVVSVHVVWLSWC
ncbi:hypothetical protein AGMMS49992_13010 [Clostridia bacterium]|nr:hypothetical protein AGMMS49992_13010 [Clostridia bacterium]